MWRQPQVSMIMFVAGDGEHRMDCSPVFGLRLRVRKAGIFRVFAEMLMNESERTTAVYAVNSSISHEHNVHTSTMVFFCNT